MVAARLQPVAADRHRAPAGAVGLAALEQKDTFDALTDLTAALLAQLGVERYAIYVQDYGAPIGWRLALRDPAAITAIITQNGNGYEAEIHLLDGGHFLLESAAAEVAALIRDLLASSVTPA